MIKKFSEIVLVVFIITLLPIGHRVLAARDPYEGFSATSLDGASITTYNASGTALGSTGIGNYFYFENVNFGKVSPTTIEVETGVPEPYAGGTIEFRVDSPTGPVIASFTTKPSDWGVMISNTARIITPVTGVRTLYMFVLGQPCNISIIRFNQPLFDKDTYDVYKYNDAYYDISDSPYRDCINTVYQLGFLKEEIKDYFYPDVFATRQDFAEIIFKIMGSPELGSEGGQAFADVSPDHKYYKEISVLSALGIIKGDASAYFRPGDYISKTDALVIMCKLLGYNVLCESKGGYPAGYLAVAAQEGLTKGLSSSEYLRLGEMTALLCNAFDATVYIFKESYSEKRISITGTKPKGEGILSETLDIYKGKGQVTDTNNTSLTMASSYFAFDKVEIEGEFYNTGATPAKSLLGYECTFYYRLEDDQRTLLSIIPDGNVTVTVLDSVDTDFTAIFTGGIEYVTDDAKRKTIKFDNNTSFIYNGVAIDDRLESLIETSPFRGDIRYIENPSKRNVVFINEYQNLFVNLVDKQNMRIGDKISGRIYEFVSGFDVYCEKAGESILFSKINANESAMLYMSKNKTGNKVVRLIMNNNTVKGTVDEISPDYIKINGEEFFVANELDKELAVGLTGLFNINSKREIIFFEVERTDEDLIGMYIASGLESNSMGAPAMIKFLSTSNNIEMLAVAPKAVVDGVFMKKAEDIVAYLDGVAAQILNTPFRYRIDLKSRITLIDTYLKNEENNPDDTFTKLASSISYRYNSGTRILINSNNGAGSYPFSTNGYLLSQWAGMKSENFSFSRSDFAISGNAGDVYSLNAESKICDVFVWKSRGIKYDTAFIFEKKSIIFDSDGVESYKLYGCTAAKRVEYVVTADMLSSNRALEALVKAAKPGDIFRPSQDAKDQLIGLDLLMLHNAGDGVDYIDERGNAAKITAKVSETNRFWDVGVQEYRAVYGTVIDKFDNYIVLRQGRDDNAPTEVVYAGGRTTVTFDSQSSTSPIDFSLAGSQIAIGDDVFVYIYEAATKAIMIFK